MRHRGRVVVKTPEDLANTGYLLFLFQCCFYVHLFSHTAPELYLFVTECLSGAAVMSVLGLNLLIIHSVQELFRARSEQSSILIKREEN